MGFSPRWAASPNSYRVAERRLQSVRDVFKRRSATRVLGLHRNRGFKPTATFGAPLRGALMGNRTAPAALVAEVPNLLYDRLPAGSADKRLLRPNVRGVWPLEIRHRLPRPRWPCWTAGNLSECPELTGAVAERRLDGCRGLQPTVGGKPKFISRRGATPEIGEGRIQASLRDARGRAAPEPWVQTHGYLRGTATRCLHVQSDGDAGLGSAGFQPADLRRLGSGARDCSSAARARPAGPSEHARAS